MSTPRGRPKGQPKSGGRKKGSQNKRTVEFNETLRASGRDPVEFMLSVMADPTQDLPLRMDAAKGAAPYVRARLAPLDANAKNDSGLTIVIKGGLPDTTIVTVRPSGVDKSD